MHRFNLLTLIGIFISFILAACNSRDESAVPSGNAMYYWRTNFSLNEQERDFLKRNDIKTLYIKFFDVDTDREHDYAKPKATISFTDSLPPELDYVPVVFIVNDCLRKAGPDMGRDIVNRVRQMAETHQLPTPREIQIDCDWTSSTQADFFALMDDITAIAHSYNMHTSVTIRLHQLDSEPPTADYGVLMVYNTGSFTDPSDNNPILSKEAVEPYLKYLGSYKLPLCAAYPNFKWPILYSPAADGKWEYHALLYGCDPEESPNVFRQASPGIWRVVSSMQYTSALGDGRNVVRVSPGMQLRIYSPPAYNDLLSIKQALNSRYDGINKRVILYDLNSNNLNLYTEHEYKEIFTP